MIFIYLATLFEYFIYIVESITYSFNITILYFYRFTMATAFNLLEGHIIINAYVSVCLVDKNLNNKYFFLLKKQGIALNSLSI